MDFGERIKQLRKDKGLTQEELANMLGLKDSAIAKYENGRVENIKRSTIAKMAEIFECSPAYLMGWKETHTTDNNYHLSPSEITHIEKYRAVDDVTKNIVDTILDKEISRPVLMAAHDDHIDEPGEKEKIMTDMEMLKNLKNNRK